MHSIKEKREVVALDKFPEFVEIETRFERFDVAIVRVNDGDRRSIR